MNQRITVGLVAFLALCAGIVGALYIAPPSVEGEPDYFQTYPEPRAISPFSLVSHKGERFDTSSLKGQWSLVFVSVDPKRDSVERLAEYVSYFNEEFIALTGEHKTLFPFVRNLGMMYAIAESTDNPNYLVDHSASVVLIDPEARVIGRFKPKREPGKLSISDSQQILADMPVIISKQ